MSISLWELGFPLLWISAADKAVLYCIAVNGFRQSSSTSVQHYSEATDEEKTQLNDFLKNQPKNDHSIKLVIGTGFKWNIRQSGIGISLDFRMTKYLDKVDSEFVDRPFGYGHSIWADPPFIIYVVFGQKTCARTN